MDRGRTENEQLALRLVDSLIEHAISTSLLKGEEREAAFGKGADTARELALIIHNMVEGRDEYVQNVLTQLIVQKLPHPKILSSFGTFSSDLRRMIEKGMVTFTPAKPVAAVPETKKGKPTKGKRGGRPFRLGRRTGKQPKKQAVPGQPPSTSLVEPNLESLAAPLVISKLPGKVPTDMALPVAGTHNSAAEISESETDGRERWPWGELPESAEIRSQSVKLVSETGEVGDTPAATAGVGSGKDQGEPTGTITENSPVDTAEEVAEEKPAAVSPQQGQRLLAEPKTKGRPGVEIDPIQNLIRQAFPGMSVVGGYTYRRDLFTYYVPELKLAFLEAGRKLKPSSDLSCRKEGIKVVLLREEDLTSARAFGKALRKAGIN